jgi:uncharacterized protein with NAD-binding domain and iron-sulfur cluster
MSQGRDPGKKVRVAVLGGGLGAMSAAFELTRTPELRDVFEVTVYSQGWRLGGKGASGRNRAVGDRIEEHGLHAFLGFYRNAFTLMQEAYAEWQKQPDNPFQSWSDAFKPQYQLSLGEWHDAKWRPWNFNIPPLPGVPGDDAAPPTRLQYLEKLIAWLESRVGELAVHAPSASPLRAHGVVAEIEEVAHAAWIHGFLGEIAAWLARVAADLRGLGDDIRRLVLLVELGVAVVRGYVTDVLFNPKGFRAIDGLDFKTWLGKHGARPDVAWSPPVVALYDLGFAWTRGDTSDPGAAQAAAGVVLQVAMDLVFASKGAPLWKMQAGMGDTVFSPVYECLLQRGQSVKLFHRVENIRLSADGKTVEAIDLVRQVDLLPGVATYTPTFPVKGVVSWPSEPFWDQIANGDAIRDRLAKAGYTLESAWCDECAHRETLERGRDFDAVVIGISVAELARIAPDILLRAPTWAVAITTAQTTPTQSMQIWLDRDIGALGWTYGETIMTAYSEPMDTWGEMSHLLVRESWPPTHQPRALEYFCSALPESPDMNDFSNPGVPRAVEDRVRANGAAYLQSAAGMIFPLACVPGQSGLDFNRLVDLEDRPPSQRIDAQWTRANIDPTERYVLSPPGSIEQRLRPGDESITNAVAAGDWTYTTLPAGCAESATESGVIAAHALIKRYG